MGVLDDQLATLETMSSARLKEEWRALTKSAAPRISPSMMRLALAGEIQARAFGGLSRETARALDQLAAAKTKTRQATPGMRLVREWNGKLTRVRAVGPHYLEHSRSASSQRD